MGKEVFVHSVLHEMHAKYERYTHWQRTGGISHRSRLL
jgi:hypothetical protein